MKISRLGIVALFCGVLVAQAQDNNSPVGLTLKKIERLKAAYTAELAAAPQLFEKSGYKPVQGGIDILADTVGVFSSNPRPYLNLDLRIEKPYETTGDYTDQVAKVLKQNTMKIVRTLSTSLGSLATGDDVAGICLNLSWGPDAASSDQVMVMLNKYSIRPFLDGKISLYEFIDGHTKLKHGNELVTLHF